MLIVMFLVGWSFGALLVGLVADYGKGESWETLALGPLGLILLVFNKLNPFPFIFVRIIDHSQDFYKFNPKLIKVRGKLYKSYYDNQKHYKYFYLTTDKTEKTFRRLSDKFFIEITNK